MNYQWDYNDKNAYNNRSGRYKTKVQYDFILNNCKGKTNKILDIAGGAGRFSIPLLEYSKNITVLDINEKAIRLLRERSEKLKTICGDFSNTEIPGTYSLILCIEALPYFKDWKIFFEKIKSLLDLNGSFIFTHTNPDSWRFFMRKLKHIDDKANPYTDMNYPNLKKLLDSCGLEIENIQGMNWIPFHVASNNILVTLFANIEKVLNLRKWHSQSPWLLISVKRKY